jgi:hypothetical protein
MTSGSTFSKCGGGAMKLPLTFFFLVFLISGCATTAKYEKYMLEYNTDAAKNELRALYSGKQIDYDELNTCLDLIDIGLLQGISSFNLNYQTYISSKDDNAYRSAIKSNNEIADATSRKAILTNAHEYLSESFFSTLDERLSDVRRRMSEITEINQAEVRARHEQKLREAEKRRVEVENDKLAEDKRRVEMEEAKNALIACRSTKEHQLFLIQEDIVSDYSQLAGWEARQTEEREITRQSGVTNLSERYNNTAWIISLKKEIKMNWAEYKRLGGKASSADKIKKHAIIDPCEQIELEYKSASRGFAN